ncbi:MAG: bifunctional glycosyltransferase family 2 protein/CDP-glycerol:glycerophosphate glycerophosphotransferase [Candidatus Nanopelagicales bacterium]
MRTVRRIRARLKPRLHPALMEAAQPRVPRRRRLPQLVTIVIPVFNVEDHLGDCLTSVIRQSYRELQIIVVDDGSRDGSLAIARSYAGWDQRISIVRQENRGLGAARNAGIARARGTYLCFVDSDDVLPVGAISRLVKTIERSSSDFVVGALARLSDTKQSVPRWVTSVHGTDRLGLRLTDFPEILQSVFAWNKLFERSFFDRVIGSFPEGVLYEDQEPTALAYAAGTFDVIRACTYHWRIRDDGSSITQQREDPRNLADRLTVLSRVLPVVASSGEEVLRSWLRKTLSLDLRPYFAVVHRTDIEAWQSLRRAILELAPMLDDELLLCVPFVDRYCALALIADRRDSVIAMLTRQDEYGSCLPGVVLNGVAKIDLDYLIGLGFAPEEPLLTLTEADLRAVAQIRSWKWRDQQFDVTGAAFVSNLPTGPDSVVLRASTADGCAVDIPTITYHDSKIDAESRDAWNSHAWGAFRATIDLERLSRARTWWLTVELSHAGLRWSGLLQRDLRGPAADVPVAPPSDQGRWVIEVVDGKLGLRFRAAALAVVEILDVTDSTISLRTDDPEVRTIVAVDGSQHRSAEVTSGPSGRDGDLVLRLPARQPLTTHETRDYDLLAVTTLGRTLRICSATQLGSKSHQDHFITPTEAGDGSLGLRRRSWAAAVERVELLDGTLTVQGRLALTGSPQLGAVLVSERGARSADEFDHDRQAGTFTASFGVSGLSKHWGFGFRVRIRQKGTTTDLWVPVDQQLGDRLPLDLQCGATAVTVSRTPKAGALWVRLRHPYTLAERGALAQRHLHRRHQKHTGEANRPAVLFDVFAGRSTGDSPRAIFEELRARDLGLELFWAVADTSIDVPAGAQPVLLHSKQWIDLLSEARYLVNNHHFPFYFRKQTGQTYVQTWHGTPLKRIANDITSPKQSLEYLALMKREARSWDFLLAQNDFAASHLPAALGYGGEVINEGYPRNDVLARNDGGDRRAAIRDRLGLTDQTAVLYAPTWRDTAFGRHSFVNHLDHEEIRRRLGTDVTVLIRGHANAWHAQQPVTARNLINVTHHPDVNDLILAADVLVTDYSSIMFDFCVTGKPMMFLVPDLETYRDQIRGFYLDLEQIAPGPLCRTTSEVVDHLKDMTWLEATRWGRYKVFRQQFAPRDDGSASRRIVDRIWGPSC